MVLNERSLASLQYCNSLWDPANAWPAGRKWIWALLAAFVVIAQGPLFLNSFRVTWTEGSDFFQDWASARNVLEGRPAYLPIADALARYVPRRQGAVPPRAHLPWNAHPPTSVVAALPFALLDYPKAGTLWNLLALLAMGVSVGLIVRDLNIPIVPWSVLPITALTLICSPIRTQFAQGQWNAPLLLLLTLAWRADRHGRQMEAGLWTGAALTLKLFPAYFLLYFAVRRSWRALLAGCLSSVGLTLVTFAVVRPGAYRDYLKLVLPTLDAFRAEWDNASLPAFWAKNCGEGALHFALYAAPLFRAPVFARAAGLLSCAAVLAVSLYPASRHRAECATSLVTCDLCYSLALVAMLLLAPICWDHYLLLLALPLALVWCSLGRSNLSRLLFLVLVTAIWVSPHDLWRAGGADALLCRPDLYEAPSGTYSIHGRLFTPFFLSVQFYALLACFVWMALLIRRETTAKRHPSGWMQVHGH
jgi:hypothetical protein